MAKKPVPVIDTEEFIRTMPDSYLKCRRYGHAWDPYTVTKHGRSWETIVICARCKTQRHELLTSRGELVKSHYRYANGYLVKGHGALRGEDRNQLRLESVIRMAK